MPTPVKRSNAQALYLKQIYKKANDKLADLLDKSEDKSHPLPLDTQGRVIVDVALDDNDWEEMYRIENELEGKVVIEQESLMNYKKDFQLKIGHPITPITSVSMDLQRPSNDEPIAFMKEQLSKHLPEANRKGILIAYQGLSKGRIISLQQEMHFHAHLIGQMLNSAVHNAAKENNRSVKEGTQLQIQAGVNNALLKLNDQVIIIQDKALEKAFAVASKKTTDKKTNKTTIVIDQEVFATVLNKELDKGRKTLLPFIAKTLRVEVIKSTGIQFDKSITKHLSKKLAESTSATPNDVVHLDRGTGFISYIGGSENTSHHQEIGGEHVADRMLYTHHFSEGGNVQPLSHRQQVRVPSIAVKKLHPITNELVKDAVSKKLPYDFYNSEKIEEQISKLDPKGKLSSQEKAQVKAEFESLNRSVGTTPQQVYTGSVVFDFIVADAVEKLTHLQHKYQLGGESRGNGEIPNAFVYNLYTALNANTPVGWIDEPKNKQSQSAEQILQAAHSYNRQNPKQPMCLVQNISVNGWGYELSISSSNSDLVNEAALMTHLASLHTVFDGLNEDDKKRVEDLLQIYSQFINGSSATSFYRYLKETNSPTNDGKLLLDDVLVILDDLKEKQNTMVSLPINKEAQFEQHRQDFTYNAKIALIDLFKDGAFGHHENGFTYQALSVFVEQSSIGGCKSANERAQAVNGRVAIFDFVSMDKTTRDELLNKYVSEAEAKRLSDLADTLEASIHDRNTGGIGTSLDSLYEALNLEGFQALVSFIDQGGHAKLGTKGVMPDTNNSETIKTHVDNASKWQCHKGLTANVLKEFCGVEKINWGQEVKRMMTAVGLAGAGGAAVGGVAFGVAFWLGITAAFPPAGIAIAIGIGVAAGVALLASVGSMIYKAATHKSATESRFEAIQENNRDIVKDMAPQKRSDFAHQREILSALNHGGDLSRPSDEPKPTLPSVVVPLSKDSLKSMGPDEDKPTIPNSLGLGQQ